MAARAVPIGNRSVFVGIIVHDLVDIVVFSVSSDNRLVVAIQAQAQLIISKIVFIQRSMRIVTVVAFFILQHHWMFGAGIGCRIKQIIVAFFADIPSRSDKLVGIVGGVRVMAAGTAPL